MLSIIYLFSAGLSAYAIISTYTEMYKDPRYKIMLREVWLWLVVICGALILLPVVNTIVSIVWAHDQWNKRNA